MHDNEDDEDKEEDSQLRKEKKPKLSDAPPVVECSTRTTYYPNAFHEMVGNMNYPSSSYRSIPPVENSYSLDPKHFDDHFISSSSSSSRPPRHQQELVMMHNDDHASTSSSRQHYLNQTNRGLLYDPPIAWNMPEQNHNQHQILCGMSMEDMYNKGYVMVPVPISQIAKLPRSVQALVHNASERKNVQTSSMSNQMNARNYQRSSVDDFEDIVHDIMSSTELLKNDYRREAPSVAARQESFPVRKKIHKNLMVKSNGKMDRLSQTPPRKVATKKKSLSQQSPPNVRRPLTAYNYFFSVERDLVLKLLDYAEKSCVTDGIANPDDISYFLDVLSKTHLPEDELEAHKKSARLKIQGMLDVHFESEKVKAPHRRMHGKITFRTLGKLIGIRWRNLSREEKMYYFDLAKEDSERFQNQFNVLCAEYNNATAENMTKHEEV